jgi:hypothetical protein
MMNNSDLSYNVRKDIHKLKEKMHSSQEEFDLILFI